jgi:hypothetical protein
MTVRYYKLAMGLPMGGYGVGGVLLLGFTVRDKL